MFFLNQILIIARHCSYLYISLKVIYILNIPLASLVTILAWLFYLELNPGHRMLVRVIFPKPLSNVSIKSGNGLDSPS